MDTAPKSDISSRLERIRAKRAQQVASAAQSTATGFEKTTGVASLFSTGNVSPVTPTEEPKIIGTDKLATPSPPPAPKDLAISLSGVTADSSIDRDTRSNPATYATSHRDKLTSRLELIKKKRSRENLDMIDDTNIVETVHKKEQSDDTVDSGIGTVRIESVVPPLKTKPPALPFTPPKVSKVSFAPPPPAMFNTPVGKPTSLQDEVMAELGMKESDLPPTIPESSPPRTPLQPPEDTFTLQEGDRSPTQLQEVSTKRDSFTDKSPAFMLISPPGQSQMKPSPIRTLMSQGEAPVVTSRAGDRDETYSISLSQTTTTGLLDWDVENVIDWLHFIQLQHLMPIFRERAISGAKLNGITQKELQFIGVANPDEQQTILHEVAELRMLWQVESETGSQLMFDDITAGLANMSVRRKDLEKELDSHVTERLNKVEEIKNEQDARINTSISLLQELQNPYPPSQPEQEPDVSQKEVEEENKRLSEGLEDLAEQSLISDSSHNTEFDTEQLQPIQKQTSNPQSPIRPPTLFRTDTPVDPPTPSLPNNPEKWTSSDICQWLSSLPLSQFVPLVQKNMIDGKQFVSREFISNKEFLQFSLTEQELLLSYLQELCPTPSTSNSLPSDPHSRQSSRAYSEMVPPPFRPMKETRSQSDTGLLDQAIESSGKDKQGKKSFFKKLIPKKFSSEKLDKVSSAPDVSNKNYFSEGELANIRAKKLSHFFGVEAQSPAIQSVIHTRHDGGQNLLRIYVTRVLPEATYKSIMVHPKDNCLQVLRLVMQKAGLQLEDTNRFSLIESCPSNPRIPERELGFHEFPLNIYLRHLDMPEPFNFELRTRPSISLQFVINVPDKIHTHTLSIQIAAVTTARECVKLFRGRIPELNDPTLKLIVEAEKENGEVTRLREHDTPVMLASDWSEGGEPLLFSINKEPPVCNEQRTTRELLNEIQELQSAVRSYCVVEQKYTSLQEEHQRMLRKSRESVNSTREISTVDQLQELDLRYQAKVQLCRKQQEELKDLKSQNGELLAKLNFIKSEGGDAEYSGDALLTKLKLKLTEKKREILINDDVQSLTEENIYLKDELRNKQLILAELEATGGKDSPNGVVLYELVNEHPDYAFIGTHLPISKTGPALGISIGKRNEPGTFIMKIIPDSIAERNGNLRIGDRLIEVNGIDISQREHSNVVSLLKSVTTSTSVKIVVARRTERDQLAQQKLAQKIVSYENLKEKYTSLEKKVEQINELKSKISEKEIEISELKTQTESKTQDGNEKITLETEYIYTRGYLDHVLTLLETEAPEILRKLPQEFDQIPTLSEANDPLNDEEWC